MSLKKSFLFFLSLFVLSAPMVRADSARVISASWSSSSPAGFSGEFSASRLFRVLSERELWIGPRVGVLWNAQGLSEVSFPLGIQTELWFVNALGLGLRTDVVIPYFSELKPVSFRITPQLLVRVFHLGDSGAMAIHLGLPYDTVQKWYAQLGVTFQLGGLPVQ